jgi:hypothetical protein
MGIVKLFHPPEAQLCDTCKIEKNSIKLDEKAIILNGYFLYLFSIKYSMDSASMSKLMFVKLTNLFNNPFLLIKNVRHKTLSFAF